MTSVPPGRPRKPGLLQVAKTILAGLLMIGKKGTWEKDGAGAQMTLGQVVVGAVIGAIVLVVVLFSVVRIVLRLLAS